MPNSCQKHTKPLKRDWYFRQWFCFPSPTGISDGGGCQVQYDAFDRLTAICVCYYQAHLSMCPAAFQTTIQPNPQPAQGLRQKLKQRKTMAHLETILHTRSNNQTSNSTKDATALLDANAKQERIDNNSSKPATRTPVCMEILGTDEQNHTIIKASFNTMH